MWIKVAISLVLAVIVLWIGSRFYSCQDDKPVIQTGNVTVYPAISENDSRVPEPAKKQGAILTVTVTPKPTITDPKPKPQVVTIYVPKDPRTEPPIASIDSGGTVEVEWTPIREPYLALDMTFHLGADVDLDGVLSPLVGVSLARIGGKLCLGPGVDLTGAGLFAGWEVSPNLELVGLWKPLHFQETRSFAVGLVYSF